jgi:hypothetical protein
MFVSPKQILTCIAGMAVAAMAQPAGKPVRSADDDWASVVTQAAGGNLNQRANAGRSANAVDLDQVVRLKQAAQSAKEFYTNHPNDARAKQAKKVEAMSLVRAVRPGDSDKGQAAFSVAGVFRADPANSIQDRFEVATLIERKQFAAEQQGRPLASEPVQHEKVADRLRSEFGDIPEVHAFYLGVANGGDAESGFRVAQRVQQMPAAPYIKAEANVVIERHDLLGTRVSRDFTDADGKAVTLDAVGKISVVFVWSIVSNPKALAGLSKFRSAIPQDTRWIYVALNATEPALNFARSSAPFPGVHCLEPPDKLGPLTEALKIRSAPFAYVFGRGGVLVGYGSPEQLPALLKLAGQ